MSGENMITPVAWHCTRRRHSMVGTAIVAASALMAVASGCASNVPLVHAPPPQLTIWLTGYSWQDNTPPGSSKVGEPILHQTAGGQGTYADPITVAVPGHQGAMAWAPGTRFYLPTVQRYVIVEDSGAAPPPTQTATHLDMWIGGQDGTKAATDDCEDAFTGAVPAIVHPSATEPVMVGPIFSGGRCHIPPQPDDLGTYADNGGQQHRPGG